MSTPTDTATIPDNVSAIFDAAPPQARKRLLQIRQLILQTAKRNALSAVEETLKWSEPAYLVKGGSTIRLAWKEKDPDCVGIYFNCNTKLIDTFREIYPDTFKYQSNRAILLQPSRKLPATELTHCLSIALRYHQLKKLPLLGA